MTFGDALEALRRGMMVARSGWNGKGMWLLQINNYSIDPTRELEGLKLLPWIGMKTADGGFVPWLASQSDMLARDWEVAPRD